MLIVGFVLAIAPAQATAINLENFDVSFVGPDGSASLQAGSHPYAMVTSFDASIEEGPAGGPIVDEALKDFTFEQILGFVGDPTAVPPCSTLDFLTHPESDAIPQCADSSAIGIVRVTVGQENGILEFESPLYNLEPAPGTAAKIGFLVSSVPISIDIGLSEAPPYRIRATGQNVAQVLEFFSAEVVIWGVPADPGHDAKRGRCVEEGGTCPADVSSRPFLTLPRACEGPLATRWEVDSWENPGAWVSGEVLTHDEDGNPRGMSGCGKLGFSPQIVAQPTNRFAESPSGLDIALNVEDDGLTNPIGIADSEVKRAVITLPEGMTLNPSQADGLLACSPGQLAKESASSLPGEGCPQGSKIGTVEVETPILEGKTLKGSLFVASPYENPFNSLIALYIVIKDPGLGVSVKVPVKVEPDPKTGQLIATLGDPSAVDPAFRELPQVPISHFRTHFREGGRSPLITPPACGTYEVEALLTPWANPSRTYETSSSFQVTQGTGGGQCAPAGAQPFAPGFAAGSINNSAARHSPFFLRFTRRDGDQDLTRFDATMPPGLVAKLAGVSECPEAAIALAKTKTGLQEQASPSCPESSLIGHLQAGAGVGSQLLYVPGKVYLAGPTHGAQLSVVEIVPAVAGPFDVGNVVTRQALRIDPQRAQVAVDGAASDPVPHILAGIPLRVRDIQVNIDRPEFTLNPTSCDPFAIGAKLWGGGLDPFSGADDAPALRSVHFQAANCARLGFKPRLALTLKGGTQRGDHPAFKAVFTPRPGDANLEGLVARLPRSAFLDQAHIRTICTRVQFAADACPPGAVYGWAQAFTPILESPVEGPVYLRSSNHNLPDLVFDLRGRVDVEVATRIDSAKGGIRASIESAPDAPVRKFILQMRGGKKGLIINSRDLCRVKSRANVQMTGHSGKRYSVKPQLRATGCSKKKQK
jgi:hypothetical protein